MNEIEKGFKKAGDFLEQIKKQFGFEFEDPKKWLNFCELIQFQFGAQWIPVGERLPGNEDVYWICLGKKITQGQYAKRAFAHGAKAWFDSEGENRIDRPDFWLDVFVPEPPKGE